MNTIRKTISIIILVFIAKLALCQPDSTFIKQIATLRADSAYAQIVTKIEEKQQSLPKDLWLNYNRACYLSLLADTTKAFEALYQAFHLGAESKNILTDTDFENLHTTTQWTQLKDTLEAQFLAQNPAIKNPELAVKLWYLGIEDQRFRSLGKNFKKPWPANNTPEGIALNEKQRVSWQTNRDFVIKYLKKNPWPGYDQVGEEGSSAAFYIAQHSDLRDLKRALRKLEKAVFSGQASKRHYAMMYDRIQIFPRVLPFKRKQLYGTQIKGKGKMENGRYVNEGYELYPLEKPETVNKRRVEMGMEPLEEYVKKWKLTFDVPQKE